MSQNQIRSLKYLVAAEQLRDKKNAIFWKEVAALVDSIPSLLKAREERDLLAAAAERRQQALLEGWNGSISGSEEAKRLEDEATSLEHEADVRAEPKTCEQILAEAHKALAEQTLRFLRFKKELADHKCSPDQVTKQLFQFRSADFLCWISARDLNEAANIYAKRIAGTPYEVMAFRAKALEPVEELMFTSITTGTPVTWTTAALARMGEGIVAEFTIS